MNTNNPSSIYTSDFFAPFVEGSGRSAQRIFDVVLKVYKIESAVDVGCGRGAWVAALRAMGVSSVVGVDGEYVDTGTLLFPKENFISMDLQQPKPLHQRFDLAYSVEVAEHLNPKSSTGFVRFMTSLAPVVLFSAAIPGQEGVGHINAQWHSFWIKEFAAQGYRAYDFIRPAIWHDENVYLHYRQNVLVFADQKLSVDDQKFSSLLRSETAMCLTLVDEDILRQQLGLRESLRRMPGQIKRWLFR